MANTHSSNEIGHRYKALEPFVREELDQQIDEEFRSKYPGLAKERVLRRWLQIRDELYLKFANGVFQSQPKRVVQRDTMLCWAAALESWLAAARGINLSQAELVKKYGNPPSGELDLRNIANFNRLAVALRIKSYAFSGSLVTYGLFLDRLATKGHLLLMYTLDPDTSHTVVVYGIGIPADGKSALTIMNPSDDSPTTSLPLEELRKRQMVLIGWKE